MTSGKRRAVWMAASILAASTCGVGLVTAATVMPLSKGVSIPINGGSLRLILVRSNVLRVHYLPGGRRTAPALLMSSKAPRTAAGPVSMHAAGRRLELQSDSMRVVFDLGTDTLRVFRPHSSAPILVQTRLGTLADRTLALRFAPTDAPLYGIHGFDAFQAAQTGVMRTGRQLATAGEQGDAGAPLVWSTAGFAVLVDSQKTLFNLAPGRIQVLRETRPDLDYYLILGAPRRIFAAVDDLTGHAPLFPKWSFGFINSQWGIDEGELLRIVRRYRALHIPLDAFSLDFDWKAWGQNDYGEFRWNRRKFPDGPSGMLDRELTALGVHLIGIMKPRIHVDTVEGRYATAHHLWMPGEKVSLDYFSHKPVKTLDFDSAATRKWFFNPVLRQSFKTGIVGWWNDEADETGDDTQFFNMERALYDGQRRYFKQRVWSLNRNFWLGAQRYAYGLWSGDIQSGFASMAAQRQRMLSAIDVGEMWWGMAGQIIERGEDLPRSAEDEVVVRIGPGLAQHPDAPRGQIEQRLLAVEQQREARRAPHQGRTGIALLPGGGELAAAAHQPRACGLKCIEAVHAVERRAARRELQRERALRQSRQVRLAQDRLRSARPIERECIGASVERHAQHVALEHQLIALSLHAHRAARARRRARRHHQRRGRCVSAGQKMHPQHVAAHERQLQLTAGDRHGCAFGQQAHRVGSVGDREGP